MSPSGGDKAKIYDSTQRLGGQAAGRPGSGLAGFPEGALLTV